MPSEEDLPPGAHRDFVLSMHRLYREAGWPATRKIADAIRCDDRYPGTINYEMVSQVLRGRTLASLQSVQSMAMVLADTSSEQRDPQAERDRISALWQAAMNSSVSGTQRADLTDDAGANTAGRTTQPPVPAPPAGSATTSAAPLEPSTSSTRALLAGGIAALAEARAVQTQRISDTEQVARRIVTTLGTLFDEQIKESGLPLEVDEVSAECTFAGRPYRALPGSNCVKVSGGFTDPHIEVQIAAVVGIAVDREMEHPFLIFDAYVPDGDVMYLTRPEGEHEDQRMTGSKIDRWAERRLHEQLSAVIDAVRGD